MPLSRRLVAEVEPCFITPGELQHQMKRLESPRECREVLLDDGLDTGEVANEVGGLALEVKARERAFSVAGSLCG